MFARELKALGCDFVDVTSGQLDPRQKIPLAPGYNVPLRAQGQERDRHRHHGGRSALPKRARPKNRSARVRRI